MRNKTVIITALICAILFVVAGLAVIYQYANKGGETIKITLEGEILYEGSATHRGEPLYIDAVGKNGVNHIRIDESGVMVESASCPNGECVAMGYLKSKYLPIVCLPNNLVISYTDSKDEEVDAISQ